MNDLIPEGMTDTAMWAVVVGFVSPLVLKFLIAAKWRPWVKSAVAFLFSAIIGTLTALLTGAFEGLGIPSTILLVLVVSIASYKGFWDNVVPTMQRGALPLTKDPDGVWRRSRPVGGERNVP